MTRALWMVVLVSGLALLPAAQEAPSRTPSNGILVRVGGNIDVGRDDRADAVVVADGDLMLGGGADVVVVVNGVARLQSARVQELVVVNGSAVLEGQTLVEGQVHLVQASLTQDGTAHVEGGINRDAHVRVGRGLFIFGVLIALGFSVAVLLGGLALVALAGRRVQHAGAVLSDDISVALVAAFALWIGLPVCALVLMPTLVGLPIGLALLLLVLPALACVGYLTSGVWIGAGLLARLGWETGRHDRYRAALLGTGVLLVGAGIPFVGAAVTPLAAFIGSGALGGSLWRAAPWRSAPPQSSSAPASPHPV